VPRLPGEAELVAHYSADPEDLSQKSHIRLNRGHAETIFRVRIQGLKPQTTTPSEQKRTR
jgi:hypothetical protein